MADDHDDQRDDVLAAALAVEPLDEVARRRLVARALDASATAPNSAVTAATAASGSPVRGRARLAAIAAAIAFLVLGVLAVALPGGDTSEVAGRSTGHQNQKAAAPSAAEAPGATATTAPPTPVVAASPGTSLGDQSTDAASSAANAGVAVADLGDLGDLTARGSRARVLDAASRQDDSVEASSATSATGSSCASQQVDDLVATGRGKLDGRDALVLVTRRADGSLPARALLTDVCEVRRLP